ncbi:hypothetical protein [Corynebacterium pacaense]|uniref:hypothetical protein n=1 Tax=Corynebacterium pacaense TaxID=1816684 RepID=UPI00117828F9|nr:hypothetical protein [Corynebacterium pacaense]
MNTSETEPCRGSSSGSGHHGRKVPAAPTPAAPTPDWASFADGSAQRRAIIRSVWLELLEEELG